jgi:hypothetical protein
LKKTTRRNYVRVKRRLIVAEPAQDGSGYSWTLAAALGEMLLFTEEKFGRHDTNYTLLGIDFSPDGGQTWTPGNCGHIIIHLGMHCLTDRHEAYRTLAHECIHLLSPTGKADANVLEEGLAVYFEQWYMHYVFGEDWWSGKINIPSYANAFERAKQLLAIDANIIKKLRVNQPVIARITAEQILEHCPAASEELALSLAERFIREAPGGPPSPTP